MCNEDGTLWVVFNGEIYNHGEIREELIRKGGHVWRTDHSDTEVILHAFEQWGIDCLERLRGMFAIALWDDNRKQLWLIRDRIGIKPLYYSIHHGRIVFASEIKALLKDPEQRKAIDEEALHCFLSFFTAPAPHTLFSGIRKLPCGTWLRVAKNGTTLQQRYWDAWDNVTPLTSASEEEISGLILQQLRTSVKLRKISDVPVGVFLSGGVDSSTNARLFAEDSTGPVKTFSIGYVGEHKSYPNELAYARRMANSIGSEHYERLLSLDDLIEFLPEMVRLQDEPIADPVCVPVYYVSKLARENGVTVAQVGEGADELFCGYPGWIYMVRLSRLNCLPIPGLAKRLGVMALELANRKWRASTEWLRRSVAGFPLYWGASEVFMDGEKNGLLSERLRKQFAASSSWHFIEDIHQRFSQKAWETSALNWMTYLDLNFRLPELLLMRVDKMSMGVALECRVPFLDHKFVELALSIPTAVKTRQWEEKYIFKKSVRGLVPDCIIDRKKQGFGVPIQEWFLERLGTITRDTVSRFCRETDLFDREQVNGVLREKWPVKKWILLNLALWWKEYMD
jgi:asparagine synthase (glutamine-hydrolysing)